MSWRLVLAPSIHATLRTLPPLTKRCIRQALDQLRNDPRAGKALEEELAGLYTLHVQRFRIVYQLEEQTIKIHAIGPRPSVYNDLIAARRYATPHPGHGYLADRPRRKRRR